MTGPPQHEIPLGIVGVVQRGPYPIFPEKPIARIRWAMKAPIAHTSGKAVLMILAIHADEQGKAWPPPLSRVKLGIGWSRGVARDAEQ